MSASQLPTTVFSGFLGSGKTTIISHLIDQLQHNHQQVVYIKNEIGDQNVDGQLMQGKNIATKELLNGCICCTLVGPFIQAIDEIVDTFHPDRLLIEASGAADPSAIALMIDSHPRLKRDGIISIIDVVNFDGYRDLSITAQNQTKFTDLLVFNKVELVDDKRKEAVVGYVRELNNHSPVVEAPLGVLSPAVAFGATSNELTHLLAQEKQDHADINHHHDHLTVDGIEQFQLTLSQQPTVTALQTFLTELPGAIYRVKGFVTLADGTQIVANKVGRRITFDPLSTDTPSTTSILVCIGFKVKRFENELQEKVKALPK